MGDVVKFPGDPHRALARAALRRLAAHETNKPDFSSLPTPEPPSKWLRLLRDRTAHQEKEPA